MSSKHKRLQRQYAKAKSLKPYANPVVEDDRHADAEDEDFLLPPVRPLIVSYRIVLELV